MHPVQQPTSASKREAWTRLDVRPHHLSQSIIFSRSSPPLLQLYKMRGIVVPACPRFLRVRNAVHPSSVSLICAGWLQRSHKPLLRLSCLHLRVFGSAHRAPLLAPDMDSILIVL
ncbi:hypothetical protein B0H14DRAFT_3458237 [Mycena olivaceomarginata]|nr:hypothetical protein B0H14DRAFT_3458237 [Mycena olivaceomarginata]